MHSILLQDRIYILVPSTQADVVLAESVRYSWEGDEVHVTQSDEVAPLHVAHVGSHVTQAEPVQPHVATMLSVQSD